MPNLQRPHFFDGRLLTAADFQAEQDYLRDRHRRHLRCMHGMGVVSGLQVTVEGRGTGTRVTVSPGFAVDAVGNEIELESPVTVPVSASAGRLWVELRHGERWTGAIPAGLETTSGDVQSAWVEEFADLALVESATAEMVYPGQGVPLARLLYTRGGWRLDRRHRVPRVR